MLSKHFLSTIRILLNKNNAFTAHTMTKANGLLLRLLRN